MVLEPLADAPGPGTCEGEPDQAGAAAAGGETGAAAAMDGEVACSSLPHELV